MKKNVLQFVTLLCGFGCVLSGCNPDDINGGNGGGLSPSESVIYISVDKTTIVADGADAAIFTVTEQNSRENITAASQIYVDGTPITGASFSTAKAGTYECYATWHDSGNQTVTSNKITVSAVNVTAEGVKLTTFDGKTTASLFPDGGDIVFLKLTDADGNDATALGTFYLNGTQLDGNRCSATSLTAVNRVTAKIDGSDVEGTVTITKKSSPKQRLVYEALTTTNCTYCPADIKIFQQLFPVSDVVVYSLHGPGSTGDILQSQYYTQSTKNQILEWGRIMWPNIPDRINHEPYGAVFRVESKYRAGNFTVNQITQDINDYKSQVGIAIVSSYNEDANTIEVEATFGGIGSHKGTAIFALVENGIMASQYGMGVIEQLRSFRAFWPTAGGTSVEFSEGQPARVKASFNYADYSNSAHPIVVDNCEVIVTFVDADDIKSSNVQFADANGGVKGY